MKWVKIEIKGQQSAQKTIWQHRPFEYKLTSFVSENMSYHSSFEQGIVIIHHLTTAPKFLFNV